MLSCPASILTPGDQSPGHDCIQRGAGHFVPQALRRLAQTASLQSVDGFPLRYVWPVPDQGSGGSRDARSADGCFTKLTGRSRRNTVPIHRICDRSDPRQGTCCAILTALIWPARLLQGPGQDPARNGSAARFWVKALIRTRRSPPPDRRHDLREAPAAGTSAGPEQKREPLVNSHDRRPTPDGPKQPDSPFAALGPSKASKASRKISA